MPDDELEKLAKDQGQPTDPEAYQDGGLSTAGTALTLAGAEMLAALLKAEGVPAWVRSPLGTLVLASQPVYEVMVPTGRLADAERLLAEHQPPPGTPVGAYPEHPEDESPDEPRPGEQELFDEAEHATMPAEEAAIEEAALEGPPAMPWWTVVLAVVTMAALMFVFVYFWPR
jgi:hypothetical protein